MKRIWIAGAIAAALIVLFFVSFSASFPIARSVDERAMAALVRKFPPGSSYRSAEDYLSAHYRERGPIFWRDRYSYSVYAGGIPEYVDCESFTLTTLAGAKGRIGYWAYGYIDAAVYVDCSRLLWLAPNLRERELSGHQTEIWACESDAHIREWRRSQPGWAKLVQAHMFPC